MANNRRWTETDKQILHNLHSTRKTAKEIAVVLGRTVPAIHHQLRRMGLKLRLNWDEASNDKLRHLIQERKTLAEISDVLGYSTRTIYKRLAALGIKRSPPTWTKEANARLKELYLAGQSIQQISEQLKCSVFSVTSQAAKLKLSRRKTTSKYRGVSWYVSKNKWRVSIYTTKTGQVIVGVFDTEEEAAKAYDKYVKKMGLDRPLNFPG